MIIFFLLKYFNSRMCGFYVEKSLGLRRRLKWIRVTAYTQFSRTHRKCLSTYNSSAGKEQKQEVPCNLVVARLDPKSLRDPISRVDSRSQTKENNHFLRVCIK